MDKQSHHLWSLFKDESGTLKAKRERQEPESFNEESKMDKSASVKQASKDLFKLYWGLVGANLVNDTFTSTVKIPKSVVAKLNEEAKGKTATKKLASWDELREEHTDETISMIREAIAEGMKIRIASLTYNLPFIAAADIVFGVKEQDSEKIKQALNLIRENKIEEAKGEFGKLASDLCEIYDNATKGLSKLAVDESASDYWESYYGPYGKTLVTDIKKRVKADLLVAKLVKSGVDSSAADYWSSYYDGDYGKMLVKDVSNKKK